MTRQKLTWPPPTTHLTIVVTKVKIININSILSQTQTINSPLQRNPSLIKSQSSKLMNWALDLQAKKFQFLIIQYLNLKSFKIIVTKQSLVAAQMCGGLLVALHLINLHLVSLKTQDSKWRNKMYATINFIDLKMTIHSAPKTTRKTKYL